MEIKKPGLSYIISTKNRAGLIVQTLNSLVAQTDEHWEAVVVDDGDDNTHDVIKKMGDCRIRYYKMSPNHGKGASCARNMAAMLSRSDILAILDSDDIALPKRTEITIKTFENNPKLDVFYGAIEFWNEETGETRPWKTSVSPFSRERMLEESFIPHSTVAIKRDVLINNPYNQFFTCAEDYELLTRLSSLGKRFGYTKETLARYRFGAENMSTGTDKKGEIKRALTGEYGKLVKMVRGKIPTENSIFDRIASIENEIYGQES